MWRQSHRQVCQISCLVGVLIACCLYTVARLAYSAQGEVPMSTDGPGATGKMPDGVQTSAEFSTNVSRLRENVQHVTLLHNGTQVTWSTALEAMQAADNSLRSVILQALQASPYQAFFFECPPVNADTVHTRGFEFVLINAPHLAKSSPDPEPFSAHLQPYKGQPVARRFTNLGGDSMLVSPAWAAGVDPHAYTHLANFVRSAPSEQLEALWIEVGSALEQRIKASGKHPVWFSTEGSGVSWLHMRMDPTPKYYHWDDYRRFDRD
mmetsp:Transcript_6842/g.12049  ORF Transcript_6842/g.12049 Transcript_6842/m.12049 type:complete len:265 (+) Transcript_6842:45-839(+)